MNYLSGRRVYFGGPIEFDGSADWRTPVKKTLLARFGLKVFDPAADPKQGQREKIEAFKAAGRFDELAEVVHEFVRLDLAIVDRADFVIQHLPYRVPTTGTVHEIINSNNAKKPTLLVCPQGKGKIPDWYFGFIPHEFMFGSWDDLYTYLQDVDDGKHQHNNRWFFTYNYTKLRTF